MEMFGVLVAFALLCSSSVVMSQTVPALFAFGDSLVDSGDNARVGLPYGIDFPGPPSRFCNGRVVVDYIASHLGLPYPPAYFRAGNDIMRGANFGSAGSGIVGTRGQNLASQIGDFEALRQRLVDRLGASSANTLVARSIFYLCSGNNDVNNMFQSTGGVPLSYQETIISTYMADIQRLYSLGARKFVIVGLSAVGCIPVNVRGGQCAPAAQAASASFNGMLRGALQSLRNTLEGSHIVMTNFFELMEAVHNSPQSFGFTDSTHACCPVGSNVFGCHSGSPVCPDRSRFAFWDAIHQTQAFNAIAAERWFSGSRADVNPMNIAQLALA